MQICHNKISRDLHRTLTLQCVDLYILSRTLTLQCVDLYILSRTLTLQCYLENIFDNVKIDTATARIPIADLIFKVGGLCHPEKIPYILNESN